MISGVVRKFDNLGRIVPPREMCKTLGIQPGDPVDIYMDGGRIVIEPLKLQCVSCGNSNESALRKIPGDDIFVCLECLHKFKGMEPCK